MGMIRVLDEHVANLIAAGEVVERPASVVKELVENAVDAGADTIRIQIEEGGLTLIRVMDNGRGIDAEDVPLAFQRHATSKVSDSRDLYHIRTLGFRGEALPSIASVARVELVSATDKSGLGARLAIEGGKLQKIEDTRTTRGTDISVRDLFYNTPARLKYMKTVQTEFGHISDFVYRIALAHPDISFSLLHNDKTVFVTPGGGDLQQTIAAIYGIVTARAMTPVEAENADFTLTGWIGKPELTRANRYGITTIVNGRYVRSYALQAAIVQAYHTLLPINRYPLVVLQFTMDPSLVDVNVHPAKLEVRFSKEKELTSFVETALREGLLGTDLIPRIHKRGDKPSVIQEQLALYRTEHMPSETEVVATSAPARPTTIEQETIERSGADRSITNDSMVQPQPQTNASIKHELQAKSSQQERRSADARSSVLQSYDAVQERRGSQPQVNRSTNEAASVDWRPYVQVAETNNLEDRNKLPELRIIGQLHGTYIVAENEDGLYLIDQHAAHERINYERFYRQFGQPQQASQSLLVPITMEFTAAEADVLRERAALFAQIGVYMEPFGGNTFIIRAVPEWMVRGEELEMLQEMADWVLQDKALDVAKFREKSAIMSACKASLKANDHLSQAEIDSLLQQLGECVTPFTCPHGRPIIVSFSSYELEKMFKRVM